MPTFILSSPSRPRNPRPESKVPQRRICHTLLLDPPARTTCTFSDRIIDRSTDANSATLAFILMADPMPGISTLRAPKVVAFGGAGGHSSKFALPTLWCVETDVAAFTLLAGIKLEGTVIFRGVQSIGVGNCEGLGAFVVAAG